MRRTQLTLVALLVAAVAAGCGGADEASAPAPPSELSGKPADFPKARGGTLEDIQAENGRSLVFRPTVKDLKKGMNRYGFALYDVAGKQILGAPVALYTAHKDGKGLHGPYIARSESLKVSGPFQSRTTASDPAAAKAIYVAEVPFHHVGDQIVVAIARLDGRLVVTSPYSAEVVRGGVRPPDVGDRAIRVHTRTLAEVGGDASQLDTRVPPATDLLQNDLYDVLRKRPVVITFATPALCQTRVCGPVVDIVEQAKAHAPSDVAFIHQEIYQDNEVKRGLQGPVAAWRLQTEPWTFVIARSGRIAARFEGAFSLGELERAIAKVT